MKNAIVYALGFFVLATSAAQASPTGGKAGADRKAVSIARVKLMNDARRFGPQSAQAEADRQAVRVALEKLKGDAIPQRSHPVNVKRLPKKARGKSQRAMAKRVSRKKSPHRAVRKHARVGA